MKDHTLAIVKDIAKACKTNFSVNTFTLEHIADRENPDQFKTAWLCENLLTKFNNTAKYCDVNYDPLAAAISSFYASEDKCSIVNDRILSRSWVKIPILCDVILRTKAKIAKILGPFDTKEWFCELDQSSGASRGVKRSDASLPLKLAKPTCSYSMRYKVSKFFEFIEQSDVIIGIDEFGKYETVEKNSKTHRGIIVEPSMNMMFQKGIGSMIRKRLNKLPFINLNDQSVNAQRALQASISNLECTVDFKAASDTIAYETVRLLLPDDWFDALVECRTRQVLMPGCDTLHSLAKFSAMGNGYTFELETLIFYALAQSTEESVGTKTLVSQYGDDLICSAASYDAQLQVFDYMGFSINTEKTFTDGPFRESCGIHAFRGFDVTPFYIRRPINNPAELMLFLNNLRLWCDIGDLEMDDRFSWIWHKYMSYLPSSIRKTRVPHEYQNLGLIGPLSEHEFKIDGNYQTIYTYATRKRAKKVVVSRNHFASFKLEQAQRWLRGTHNLPSFFSNEKGSWKFVAHPYSLVHIGYKPHARRFVQTVMGDELKIVKRKVPSIVTTGKRPVS